MADGPYDDNFTEEEQAALAEVDDTPPAAETPPEGEAPDGGQPPAGEAAPPAPPAPPAPEAPPANDDAERFRQFSEQHAGKSPEELMRLAFQQERRSNRTGFEQRQTREQRDELVRRITEARDARKAAIAARREEFGQQLENDPDAATRRIAEERFAEEDRLADEEAEQALRDARIDDAYALAATAIPDFATRAPEIMAFGRDMNYSDDELRGIQDGRDMVTLYLASLTGKLIKSGMMDIRGNFTTPPPAVQATDPRLTTPPAPRTLGSAPTRQTDAQKTPEQQMADILQMSDADFAKLDDDALERLIGNA